MIFKYCRCVNISGKAITPFVLQRVNELTGGRSLKASIHNHKVMPPNFMGEGEGGRGEGGRQEDVLQLKLSSKFTFIASTKFDFHGSEHVPCPPTMSHMQVSPW